MTKETQKKIVREILQGKLNRETRLPSFELPDITSPSAVRNISPLKNTSVFSVHVHASLKSHQKSALKKAEQSHFRRASDVAPALVRDTIV